MYVSRLLFILVASIICFTNSLSNEDVVKASTYPLQAKYPEIMLYKAETSEKIIALTFDDGPDDRFTPKILDVLKKHNVKATFFLLGSRVKKYSDVAKRINQEGHIIGNHSFWHPELTSKTVDHLAWEVERNEQMIKLVTGYETKLFRAPYGSLNDNLVKKIGELGYKGVGWSVDSEDWKSLSKDEIKKNVLNAIHPGAIILMHSAGHWTQDLTGTVESLDELIPYLMDKGYHFVTVPELWKAIYK